MKKKRKINKKSLKKRIKEFIKSNKIGYLSSEEIAEITR